MILSFMTKWPDTMPEHMAGEHTLFPEKIWSCFKDREITPELGNYLHSKYSSGKIILELHPKKHTIRFLTSKQWEKWCKKDRQIHFKIWTGKPYVDKTLQFAPVTTRKGIQPLAFDFSLCFVQVFIDGNWFGDVYHHGIEDIYEYDNCLLDLAKNDGFTDL